MVIIITLLLTYAVLGISRIARDYNQPFISQPLYVRHFNLLIIVYAFLTAPSYWLREFTHPLPKKHHEQMKRLKEKERLVRKLSRDLRK